MNNQIPQTVAIEQIQVVPQTYTLTTPPGYEQQLLAQQALTNPAVIQMLETRNMLYPQTATTQVYTTNTQPVIIPMNIGNPYAKPQVQQGNNNAVILISILCSVALVIAGLYQNNQIKNSEMFQVFQTLQPYEGDIALVPYADICVPFIDGNYMVYDLSYGLVGLGVLGGLISFGVPAVSGLLGAIYTGVAYYYHGEASSGDCAEVWHYVTDALSYIDVDLPPTEAGYYNLLMGAGGVYAVVSFVLACCKNSNRVA